MTISKVEAPLLPCSGNNGRDGTVFIEIYKAHPAEDEMSWQVSVCPVLESFRSSKSEAFTPQFVGLGPYHHSHPKLPVTDELKFGVIKRVLKVADISGAYLSLQSQDVVSEIEAFYHKTCNSDSHTLAHVLTVDGLFLLAFLRILNDHNNFRNSSKHFVLTGKHYAILPVNASGVELSMDGVIRDLFMLENQVPIFAIKHMIQALDSASGLSSTDPFSIMLEFCKAHSPFAVIDEKISELSHGRAHLLHIMYMLVAPIWGRSSSRNVQEVGLIDKAIRVVMLVPAILIGPFCLCLWILLWTVAYVVVVTLHPFLKFIRFILVKVIPWSAAIFGEPKLQFPTLRRFFGAVRDLSLYYVLNSRFFSSSLVLFELLLLILSWFIPNTERALDYVFARLELDELDSSATIPSAAKLNECRIRFKGVESDIRAVKFDDRKGELELPCIKLDDTSEVILRNLAAYESCIYNGHTKVRIYIELMSLLVQTHEDVKFLVDEKIIQTQLSADAVIQVFKMPTGEPAGSHCQYPVDIEGLHMKLKTVKAKAEVINNLYLILTEFLRICAVCALIMLFFPLLSEGFHKIWCSTFFATSSGSYCGGNQVGDSAGGSDNYNIITSM